MDAIAGTDGRRALPGEHGFRFFPGFYQHVARHDEPDPVPRTGAGRLRQPRRPPRISRSPASGRANELVAPAHFPSTPERLGGDHAVRAGVRDAPRRSRSPTRCTSSRCSATCCRPATSAASASTRTRAGGSSPTRSIARPGFQKFLADGLTRSLVAARGREMSARTGGYILLQLLQDLVDPGRASRPRAQRAHERRVDRPVAGRAAAAGRRVPAGLRVERSRAEATESPAGASSRSTRRSRRRRGVRATPPTTTSRPCPSRCCASRSRWTRSSSASPALAGLDRLQVRWMNGIMYYLHRDVPLVHGHTHLHRLRVGADVDLAAAVLAAASTRTTWATATSAASSRSTSPTGSRRASTRPRARSPRVHARGDRGRGLGPAQGRAERRRPRCSTTPTARPGSSTLRSSTRTRPTRRTSSRCWSTRRARGRTARPPTLPEVENLFLASDYVQTYTDLATMEGANEAARRAVNAILDASRSDAERCEVWKLREPGGLPFPDRARDRPGDLPGARPEARPPADRRAEGRRPAHQPPGLSVTACARSSS